MSEVVVADASPIIALTQIGRLGLLPDLFGTVIAPPIVVDEVAPTLATLPAWIVVRAPGDRPGPSLAFGRLDAGEVQALRLAIALDADLVLLDDLDAREWAIRRGLPITGTAGLVLRAKRAGLLPAVTPVLAELRSAGLYLSAPLVRAVVEAAGE